MLVLYARAGDVFDIGEDIKLHIYKSKGQLKLAFEAPDEVRIRRMKTKLNTDESEQRGKTVYSNRKSFR